jgi:two-component system LytT family response regulator
VAHYKGRFECHVLTVAGFAGVPRVLEEQLDPEMFFRAGRRHIINLTWIEKVDIAVAGGLVVTLRGGQTVEMSRRQSDRLRAILSL